MGFLVYLHFLHLRLVYAGQKIENSVRLERPHVEFEDLFIPSSDGVMLNAWYIHRSNDSPVLVYNHGSDGHLFERVDVITKLSVYLECNVIAFDYRGYGLSTGVSTHEGVESDCEAIVQFTRRKLLRRSNGRLYLYGHSLGTGVVLQYVEKHLGEVDLILLENSLASLWSVIMHVAPFLLPVLPFTVPYRYNNIGRVKRFTRENIIFIVGKKDMVIPPEKSRILFENCASPHKLLVEVADGDHVHTFSRAPALVASRVAEFHRLFCIDERRGRRRREEEVEEREDACSASSLDGFLKLI